MVGTFREKPTITGWSDLPKLNVSVTGNMDPKFDLSFGGAYGGASQRLREFELWNFTYTMPSGFKGTPSLTLDLEMM